MVKVANLRPALRTVDTTVGRQLGDSLNFSDPRRGSRQERGYGAEWDRLRLVILKRDSYRCLACQRSSRVSAATQVDHIVEKADGGTDETLNLQSLCKPCHDAKSAAERARRRGYGDGPSWPLTPRGGGSTSG